MSATDPVARPALAVHARVGGNLCIPAIAGRTPKCLSPDDIQELAGLSGSLPGGGLRRPGSSRAAQCVHFTGIELVGFDADGTYWVQICRDGCITAARGRGLLHLHAAAVAEELRWHDRIRYAPLHSALRPKGSLQVDVARLAEVARSMPGCTVKLEAKAVPNTVQLVFAAPPRVETGVRYGVQADDVVIDINVAGHMRARSRRCNIDGGLGGFSGSKPELAEKVREQLLVTQSAWGADAADAAADFGANYLFTSVVLTRAGGTSTAASPFGADDVKSVLIKRRRLIPIELKRIARQGVA